MFSTLRNTRTTFIHSCFSSYFGGHQLPAKGQEMLLRPGPHFWRFDADSAQHPPIQLVKIIHQNLASNTHPSYPQPTLQIMKGSRVVVVKEKHEAAEGSLEENRKERNGKMNDDCGCWQKKRSRSRGFWISSQRKESSLVTGRFQIFREWLIRSLGRSSFLQIWISNSFWKIMIKFWGFFCNKCSCFLILTYFSAL